MIHFEETSIVKLSTWLGCAYLHPVCSSVLSSLTILVSYIREKAEKQQEVARRRGYVIVVKLKLIAASMFPSKEHGVWFRLGMLLFQFITLGSLSPPDIMGLACCNSLPIFTPETPTLLYPHINRFLC